MAGMSGNNITNIATNVGRAVVVALDWNSTPEARNSAVDYLDSIKVGDIGVLAGASFLLVKRDWSPEIRLHAFKLLQNLVRSRWDEFNPTDRRNFSNLSVDLMSEIASPCEDWALKSQTAALVAEIFRREGLILWKELLPVLVSLSSIGPLQAELVSMTLRWLPEDITDHNEDLEGDHRRSLLRGLTQSLPEILPLLYTLLEKHLGAALNEVNRQQPDILKQHAAAVTATLNAINAYAEWAALSDLDKYGIIRGCGFLLSSRDFRLHACEFFKLVSLRKRRPVDTSDLEFDPAMRQVFQVLMDVSEEYLTRSSTYTGVIDASEFEFAEYVCQGMVSLGNLNLHCIAGNNICLTKFLQEMLGFFKHYKFNLHLQSLEFWLVCIRDLISKPKSVAHSARIVSSANSGGSGSRSVDNDEIGILSIIGDGFCSEMIDTCFQRLLKQEKVYPETATALSPLELWSDEFEDNADFSQYRSKLLELVKCVTSYKPLIAATKISERLVTIVQSPVDSSIPAKDLAVMESMQFALENVVSTVFDESNGLVKDSPEVHLALCRIFEGLLQQLLALKWTEPALVQVLGHYLDALGPVLKYFPDAAGSLINKLFELLNSLPFAVQGPSRNSAKYARLQICTSFIQIAKAAGKSVLPHMKGIADTMAYLQRQDCLLRWEYNLLGEAILIMASVAGRQQQEEALVWLLEPLSQQWTRLDWQKNYLSDPMGLVHLCSDTSCMWSVFYTVTFFEKCLKRSGVKKGNSNFQSLPEKCTSLHLMAPHLSWMLPPLLKILRSMHSLWSPSIIHNLPKEMKEAMTMSEVEQCGLIGEGKPKTSTYKDRSHTDMNKEGTVEFEYDVRHWLKGIRYSGYSILGLSATLGDAFFKGFDPRSVCVALMENIQSMEFRHLRQLVHSILIPLVKSCPFDMWDVWLEILLNPLFSHAQQALSCSWSSLLHDGRAKVPDSRGIVARSDLKVEAMEEELLRDLTRKICSLLSEIASPVVNTALPSLEQPGHIIRIDKSCLKDLDAFVQNSMVGFVLKHKTLVPSALRICLEAFTWTDCQSVTKVSSFCTAVVQLTASANSLELREFVCNDLFSAIIKGLSLESNAIIGGDLIGLCRVIYISLCDRDPSPRKVILSLPSITPQDLLAFEEALAKTNNHKVQKQLIRSLLMLATGNKLKALTGQKGMNVITKVSSRLGNVAVAMETKAKEAEVI